MPPTDREPAPHAKKFRKELYAGTVALLLLAVLHRARRAMYGYEIAKRLEETTGDGLGLELGTLYPALRSLERQGLLESRVEPSVAGPPRKYYSPTAAGREALERWSAVWARTRDAVEATLGGRNDASRRKLSR